MFIPVGERNANQTIYIVDKDKFGNIKRTTLMGVRYGMLTDVKSQLNPPKPLQKQK